MTVIYPSEINCQVKVLIMRVILDIEFLFVQNLSNTKRYIVKQNFEIPILVKINFYIILIY